MKSRQLIILSAIALFVLLFVQYIFITDTYLTKQKQFDSHFGNLVKEGMVAFNSLDFTYDFDSVLFLLDNKAVEFMFSQPDSLNRTPGQVFHEILNQYREPEFFLRDYVRKTGEDPKFTYHIQLEELYLVDLGYEEQVYPDTTMLPGAPRHALLAGTFTYERNFFRISYGIYVDFVNRSKLILREMWLIFVMELFTLSLVFTVFILTFRNMLRQNRLSEMKTDFINNMTHELKTPLSTISVASSALGNPAIFNETDKVTELSGLIKKQNRHLSELIDRILDINIWERDQVRLRPEHIHVEPWIRELIQVFRINQGEACAIDLKIDLRHPTHLLDEVHMSTVINNLLSNAVKYGKEPCLIGLELTETPEELCMEVRDNGPGIRKEELRHLFEKFYRGAESKQRVIRGLGLGLYYVKQIVEAHHGVVSVKSIPGKGSTFTIKIPVDYGPTAG
jgi:two-component system phosphate regulon sensor histidine kinase PhoR